MSSAAQKVAVTLGLLLLLVVSQCLGFWIPGVDIVLYLVAGWIPFLNRVVPQMDVRWDLALSTLAYAAALVVGAHLFLRWLFRATRMSTGGPRAELDASPRAWRWRWTLGGFSVLFLMFAAGISMVGITHQATWLARSSEPLYRPGHGRAHRIKCASNLRQIGQALRQYAAAHDGRLPDDLGALITAGDLTPDVFVCPGSDHEPPSGRTPEEIAAALSKPGHCSYLYFGRDQRLAPGSGRVVATESPENHRDEGVNVLFADGRVTWMDTRAAEGLLLDLGFERIESPQRR